VYPVADNTHVDGILDCTVVPHPASGATDVAERIAAALDYVGVLAVEMFLVGDRLLVNELAPRPHNSGHWTLDAARTSQFEQQVRAVCGVGLGDPSLTAPAVAMVNLLGDLWADGEPDWSAALAEPNASLHLYGKVAARPGRKMGHITVTAATTDEARQRALAIRTRLVGR
jgi:5-(carboxyamino)imidazole ribonucleotide synthase